MVREVKALRRKLAEDINEAKLPPVVTLLIVDALRAELQQIVQIQEAAEAVADNTPPEKEKETEA